MKCKNCPALRSEGYEYPEEYCVLQTEDNITTFADGDNGCFLRRSTIEKRVKENDEAYASDCEEAGKDYVLVEEIEKKPEMLCDCIFVLREIFNKPGNGPEPLFGVAIRKLMLCEFVQPTAEGDGFLVTPEGSRWMKKYKDFDFFDVAFVVHGSVESEDTDMGSRIECSGFISEEGGYSIADGRAYYKVLAKTPQDALSIATSIFEEDDFVELDIGDTYLEHIYQISTDKYFYKEDL